MNKKLTVTLLLLSIFTIKLCLAQKVYKLSVDELFDKGISNSIAIKSSLLKLDTSKSKKSLAKNKLLPDIQVSGLFGYVGQSTVLDTDLSYLSHPKSPDWKQNYQISLSQPLYQGGRIRNNIKKADLEEVIAELALSQNKSDIKLWLINKYLDLYNLYKQKEAYNLHIKQAESTLRNIEKMREQGMITENDVLRSQIQLNNYKLTLEQIVDNITIASQQLTIALGMDETLIYEPDSAFLTINKNIDKTPEDYIEIAYTNYPNLKIAKTNTELAKTNLKTTKADFLPGLALQFGNTFQRPIPATSPVQDLYVNSWGVTLSLSYRLSGLFDRKHSLSVAKAQINIQQLAEELQKQNIRTGVRAYYLKHQESLHRIDVLSESVSHAIENYRIVNTKYFNQLAILTDLLDASSVQLDAQLQLTTAKTNAIYIYYQLLNICGQL